MKTSEGLFKIITITTVISILFCLLLSLILDNTNYGFSVFFCMPFMQGFITALIISYKLNFKTQHVLIISLISIISNAVVLLFMGVEGLICLVMASPFIFLCCFIGASIGWMLHNKLKKNKTLIFAFVLLINPASIYTDINYSTFHSSITTTSLQINAPIHTVWSVLNGKVDLGLSANLFLKAGVTHPTAFQINTIHDSLFITCFTNNGNTNVAITEYKENNLIRFSPQQETLVPMRELTPYDTLDAAHLHGYLKLNYGEFTLTAVDSNTTILEAITSYAYKIEPFAYWEIWSNYIFDKLHIHVLTRIKDMSESNIL
jgi:hypothetical protein